MKDRKGLARWMFLMVFVVPMFASCSDDDADNAVLSFDVPSVYFSGAGAQKTVLFSARGVERLYVSAKPQGWSDDNVVLDAENRSVIITVPEQSADESVASSGTITLAGYSSSNRSVSASLFVGIAGEKILQGPANSFIASEKETHYTFVPMRADGSDVQPVSVGVIWQSAGKLLQYVDLDEDNRISFYVGADADRTDEIKRGNGLIGAYDAAGNLLWSWHIWTVPYDPEQDMVEWNGYRLMSRNLGALNNANTTAEERLASYGLFYQWGRKDPFVGPGSYRANNGSSALIYNADGASTKLTFVESSAETGTESYALQHPLCFITGVGSNGYDWLWDDSAVGWSEQNDPCPYGWQVAPAEAFVGLLLDGQPTAADCDLFGWKLTDGATSSLFMAAGRRVYLNGKIQNVYQPAIVSDAVAVRSNPAEEAQPWVGLYWTADAAIDRNSKALYFWYDKKSALEGETETGRVFPAASYARANGMSVRCVKKQ